MAGRPRGFDRDLAVDRLVQVFWDYGFEGASIDALQKAIGVKRGSFYAAFGDKEAAFVEALKRYVDKVALKGVANLGSDAGARAGLAAFVRFVGGFMAGNSGRGCLLCSTVTDMPAISDVAKDAVIASVSIMGGRVRETVRAVAAGGELREGETEAGLSSYVEGVILGLNAMARSGAGPDAIMAAAQTSARFIEQ
jgi:TetR/AcrR family transcriptional regulator, transcriptional repressor for nem operon